MRVLYTIGILFVLSTIGLSSQSHSVYRFGAFVNIGYAYHDANFQQLPGIPSCCPRFETGKGNGSSIGATVDIPLYSSLFLHTRIGYNSLQATLRKEESTTIISNGVPTQGVFTHSLNADVSGVTIHPMLGLEILNDVMLYAGTSVTILTNKNYSQEERITKPTDSGTFTDFAGNNTYQRVRNVHSGIIPNVSSTMFAINAGLGIELPVSADRSFVITPELQLSYGITPVASGLAWNISTIRAGATISYGNVPPKEKVFKFDTVYKRDTIQAQFANATEVERISIIPKERKRETSDTIYIRTIITEQYEYTIPKIVIPEKPTLLCSIAVNGMQRNGEQTSMNSIVVEEFRSDKIYPLLPYIFFDANSSDIPSRYSKLTASQITSFSEKLFLSSTNLDVYYHLLNIVGKRLQQYPEASITITGCTSDDEGIEKGNSTLAEQRAQRIKGYLQNVWGVASARLIIQSKGLPEKHSNTATQQGAEENRRVELIASRPEILDVLFLNDTIRQVTQPAIQYTTHTQSSVGINTWELISKQNDNILKHFSGSGTPPDHLEWQIENEQATVPRLGTPLQTVLTITDSKGNTAQCTTAIPLQQITVAQKMEQHKSDKRIDNFNLILFDFNSAELGLFNKRITKLIQSKLQPLSVLTITGHTDQTGDEATNTALSQQRATAVANVFNGYTINAKGLGKSGVLYNNNIPEGRMYSRTVAITVVTQTK